MRGFAGYTTEMCPRAGKLRGCIGVGCETCGGIWAKNGRKLTIFPRTFILGRISRRTFGLQVSRPRSFLCTGSFFRASVLLRAAGIGFFLGLYDKSRCGHFCGGVRLRGDYTQVAQPKTPHSMQRCRSVSSSSRRIRSSTSRSTPDAIRLLEE